MTEKIILELTKEEFYALDRNIMMVEETESILEKIKEGYKKLEPLKSPAEEAYKRVYAGYPDTSTDDYGIYYDPTWKYFIVGYEAAKQEEPEENEWKSVALHFGEELVSISPYGYYDFTPDEWLEWVINTYEKLCDDTVNLLKQKSKKKERLMI